MIDQAHAHHVRRLVHAPGEQQVLGAGERVAARVGMEEHHAGGAAQQALLEDLARLDGGAVQGAAEDLRVAEQAVPDVEEERSHHLLVALVVAQGQVAHHLRRARERLRAAAARSRARRRPSSTAASRLAALAAPRPWRRSERR